eukprot:SAG31_NODE_43_length_31224_cov_10.112578_10_plen_107_part_00
MKIDMTCATCRSSEIFSVGSRGLEGLPSRVCSPLLDPDRVWQQRVIIAAAATAAAIVVIPSVFVDTAASSHAACLGLGCCLLQLGSPAPRAGLGLRARSKLNLNLR